MGSDWGFGLKEDLEVGKFDVGGSLSKFKSGEVFLKKELRGFLLYWVSWLVASVTTLGKLETFIIFTQLRMGSLNSMTNLRIS